MKTLLMLTTLCLALFLNANAQAPDRFIRFHAPVPTFSSRGLGIIETNYGYMLSGLSVDTAASQSGYWVHTLMGLDFDGNKLWQRNYGDPNTTFLSGQTVYNPLQKCKGEIFLTAGAYDQTTDVYYGKLFVFDEFGDTLLAKNYFGDAIDSILEPRSIHKTADNGFLMTGGTYSINTGNTKAILLRTDSSGNVLWYNKYNLSAGGAYGNCVIEDPASKRLIMVGTKNSYSNSFVCITDSLGALLHQKFFSGPNGGILVNVKRLSDGTFVSSGVEDTGVVLGSRSLDKAFVVRFDIDGTLIWKKTFGTPELVNEFSSLEILDGDTIMVAGQIDTFFTRNLGLNTMYQLYKIAPNGEEVWHTYVDITTTNANQDIVKGLTLTSDGGFAMSGNFLSGPPNNPFVIVKLDSRGCVVENCNPVSVLEPTQQRVEFSLYPNPADSKIRIELKGNDAAMTRYEITDLSGKVVQRGPIAARSSAIDLGELPPAAYIMRVWGRESMVTNRLFSIQR